MRYETIPKGILYPYYLTVEAGLQKLEHSLLSIQILMSVHPALMTVMSKLSVITLRDPLIAHAAPDTLEMEHHAPVNHHVQCNKNHNYNEVRDRSTPQCFCIHITFIQRPVCKSIRTFLLSIQTSTSVGPTPITVMSKLSVITLRDPLTVHAALDTLEME